MPKATVFDMAGKQVGEIELSEAIFGIEPNESVVHDMVKNHLANLRQGTQSALTRAEVSGGGKKPWRQKGTGRARQGSIRAPQWTHGGIVFAPKPRSYRYHPEQEGPAAWRSRAPCPRRRPPATSSSSTPSRMSEVKTKTFQTFLNAVQARQASPWSSPPSPMPTVYKSARNIPGVNPTFANVINVYDILNAGKLVVDKAALAKIEEVFA